MDRYRLLGTHNGWFVRANSTLYRSQDGETWEEVYTLPPGIPRCNGCSNMERTMMLYFTARMFIENNNDFASQNIDTGDPEIEDTGTVDSGIVDTEDSSSDTGDSGETPMEGCDIALQINIDGTDIDSGSSVSFPSRPARTDPTDIELIMTNDCDIDLRFLGFPDDWMEGTGFSIATLPPILIPPQRGKRFVSPLKKRKLPEHSPSPTIFGAPFV